MCCSRSAGAGVRGGAMGVVVIDAVVDDAADDDVECDPLPQWSLAVAASFWCRCHV